MPGALPEGEPVPSDGGVPEPALRGLAERQFGVYLHVPFCRVRCGYCDFNTYTLPELGIPGSGAGISSYADTALSEIALADRVLRSTGEQVPAVSTVFIGGGTPTMLAAADLVRMVDGIRNRFGLIEGAEITTEANPDTVTAHVAHTLAAGGFTRVSIGMQSAVPHVLATLDRTHDPANVERAVGYARDAGLQVSLDLIYGTPGESPLDWQRSLEAVVALGPDHVSAYALVVEDGTKLAAQVRRGAVPMPQDDDEALKYEMADEMLAAAGYGWYEISNWAARTDARCAHNESYWRGDDWWGIGPGAHSHVGGVRWWNVKHPTAYADRLGRDVSPGAGREILTEEQLYDEKVLLGIRLIDGLGLDSLAAQGRSAVAGLIADELVQPGPALRSRDRRVVLTLRGRMLADTVVRRLLGF